jgi:hypothetical protein
MGTSHGRRQRRRACDRAAFRQIAASHARAFPPWKEPKAA